MSDDLILMIEDCEKRNSKLTEWELEFVLSIGERVRENHALSKNQMATLEKIWERIT